MKHLRIADKAWIALALGVIGFDILAPEGEMLSEGVDRYITARPILTTATVLYVSGHLLNLLPPWLDVFHQLAVWGGKEHRLLPK